MPKPKSKKQKKWKPKLYPIHKHQWHRAYKKLLPKIYRLKKLWGDWVEDELFEIYGTKCQYCDEVLRVENISIDHIKPDFRGGKYTKDNADIICKRCNTRKDKLNKEEYKDLLDYLDSTSDVVKKYVLRKLAQRPAFRG